MGADHGSADLASPNVEHMANVPTPVVFSAPGSFNSDLAFWKDLLFAGNYSGFRIIDISDPEDPEQLRGAGPFRTDAQGVDVYRLLDAKGKQFRGGTLHHMNPQTQESFQSPGG